MSSTVLITGANRGVGLALARHYADAGWEVIGVCSGRGDDTAELKQVAAGIAERIEALILATTGGFWHSNGEPLPW